MRKTILGIISVLCVFISAPLWADEATAPVNNSSATATPSSAVDNSAAIAATDESQAATVVNNTDAATTTTSATKPADAGTSATMHTTHSTSATTSTPKPATEEAAKMDASKATATKNDSNLKATLKLSRYHSKLYASVFLVQPQATHGTLKINWIAPANSGCSSSEYTLNYKYRRFHTRAFRTIVQHDDKGGRKVCAGTWEARILDSNNQVLAQATFDVQDKGRHPKTADNQNNAVTSNNAATVPPGAPVQTQSTQTQPTETKPTADNLPND